MSPSTTAILFSAFFFGVLWLVARHELRSNRRPMIAKRTIERGKEEQKVPTGLPHW